jgi:hypothetical protein
MTMTERDFEAARNAADVAALRAHAYRHGQDCARADFADGSRFLNVANFDFEDWLHISASAEIEQALSAATTDDPAGARERYRQAFEAGYRETLRSLMLPTP